MVKVTRWWNFNPVNLKFDVDILRKRPRIDYRVSEYVFEYFSKKIFITYGIVLPENYEVFLAMDTYDIKRRERLQYTSPYNTNTTKFSSMLINRMNNGKEYLTIHIECFSLELNECIKPIDYANIVYAMFSDFLVKEYKKKSRELKLKVL